MFRRISPPCAIEMSPVSSETTTMMASEISLMPIAARCRVPNDLGTSLCVTGRMHLAATIRSPSISAAPSCSGAFLKKMFLISDVDTLASRAMPPSAISRRSLC